MPERFLRLTTAVLLTVAAACVSAPALAAQAGGSHSPPPRPPQDTASPPPLYIVVTEIADWTRFERAFADSEIVKSVRAAAGSLFGVGSAATEAIADSACSKYRGACHVLAFKEFVSKDGKAIAMEIRLTGSADPRGRTVIPQPPPDRCPRRPELDASWDGCRDQYFKYYYTKAILDHNRQYHQSGGQR